MKYILSIDAGTTGITILLINNELEIIDNEYSEFTQIYPKPGWVEHDPEEIWTITFKLLKSILSRHNKKKISCIGIANQRETTVLWNNKTGKPVYNAIVWQDRRTIDICNELIEKNLSKLIKDKTGLLIDSYFSGTKIKWIFDNNKELLEKALDGDINFGTIDTWLLWKLTNGGQHKTDYTNASRTLIFNIDSKEWDKELLKILNIPNRILPKVCNSSHIFGYTDEKLFNMSIPISGIAGDQQSALFGQFGFSSGSIKTTYGTGCFMLLNTGNKKIISNNGSLTTLACDFSGNPIYALEGSVFIGGAIVQWLRDELNLINNAEETEKYALSIDSSEGVYIVPAFTGLGAPYWDMEARGLITGLTRGSNKAHIIRASLESIAFQVYDLLLSLKNDTNIEIFKMNVDGGASKNNFLMKFQSNILNIDIVRPINTETTALGAAMLAGLKLNIWSSKDELISYQKIQHTFNPNIDLKEKNNLINGWKKAIKKAREK